MEKNSLLNHEWVHVRPFPYRQGAKNAEVAKEFKGFFATFAFFAPWR